VPLEEELEDEAAVEEQHLREPAGVLGVVVGGLAVAGAGAGLDGAYGAHQGTQGQRRRGGGALEQVAEVAPLVALHGAELGAAAVVGADGHEAGLVQRPVRVADAGRDAEDGEGAPSSWRPSLASRRSTASSKGSS